MWGAHSLVSQDIHTYEEMVLEASKQVLAENFAQRGQFVVVVAGIPFAQAGTTNNLRIIQC